MKDKTPKTRICKCGTRYTDNSRSKKCPHCRQENDGVLAKVAAVILGVGATVCTVILKRKD